MLQLAAAVMEITGYEEPIILGLTRRIRCSTRLPVVGIQWLLVGVDIPLESTTEQELVLTIDPEDTALNGAMFTCHVTTSSTTYEQTVKVIVKGVCQSDAA